MGCCGNHNHEGHNINSGSNHSGNHAHNSHKWMMILCMLPIVLVAVLLFTNSISLSSGNSWILLLILLCPLSHFVLMPLLMRKKNNQP